MDKKHMVPSERFVEAFDIKNLIAEFPEHEIRVNTNRIYLQIAKFDQNPKRKTEVQVLKAAAITACNKNHYDSQYVAMKLEDVILCFGKNLKLLPKSTFAQTVIIDLLND